MEPDAPSPATWGQLLSQSPAFPGTVSLVALGACPPLMPSACEELTPEPLDAEQIVMLAERTLMEAVDKPIVIADEPTAFLTPELTIRMLELLRKQAEAGKTVLVTSRKPQVVDYADQVMMLER